ncbi:MAG TPA: hypothetical protein VG826_06180 [Pirellulales bacterium]|nr:hypothetical protein [Pirellulales bacterium]
MKTMLWLMALVGWTIVTIPFWFSRYKEVYRDWAWERDRPQREAKEKATHIFWFGSLERYEESQRSSIEENMKRLHPQQTGRPTAGEAGSPTTTPDSSPH